jgi:hypothetical protein
MIEIDEFYNALLCLKNGSITEKKVIATKTQRHQENQAILDKSTLVPWCLGG